MVGTDALQDTVAAVVQTLGARALTVERSPGETVLPPQNLAPTESRGAELVERLTPSLRPDAALLLHGTIGEGGMGVVRLGTQRSLGREVAVKTLRAEVRDHAPSTARMLREAWVTGRLEHPNVVPVYDIAVDEEGRPQIVLKKIDGAEWASLMHDATAVEQKHGAADLLEWNLQILMSLCNAVHFAHSRGVLHRDLKPENVMIGAFGEVYLVDWGIALGLGDDPDDWLPRASEASEMAGTPVYMAPEMLGGVPSRLSAQTDIYLLGAILYEVVSGDAPHTGSSLMEIISSVVVSEPTFPADVPVELRRIVSRAMHRDPDERFRDAEEVRIELSEFLRFRAGVQLARRADARLTELEGLLEAATSGAVEPDLRRVIYEHFGECRFGFRHALEVWPSHDAARQSLDRAVTRMVRFELSQDEPEAARALLSELSAVPTTLDTAVAEAHELRSREDAELRRVSADQDPNADRRVRLAVVGLVGTMWVFGPLISVAATRAGWSEASNERFVTLFLGYTLLLVGLGVWQRAKILRTRINRQVATAVMLGVLCTLAASVLGYVQNRPADQGPVEAILALSAIGFTLAAGVDRRLVISGFAYLVSFFVMSMHGWSSYVISACNFTVLLNVALLWWRPQASTVRSPPSRE